MLSKIFTILVAIIGFLWQRNTKTKNELEKQKTENEIIKNDNQELKQTVKTVQIKNEIQTRNRQIPDSDVRGEFTSDLQRQRTKKRKKTSNQ